MNQPANLFGRFRVAIDRARCVGDGLRFALAGIANTLLTFIAYQLFLFAMPHQAAYTLAWVCGLSFVVLFYPSRVFVGGRTDPVARFNLGVSYVAIFFLGLATLEILDRADIMPRISILFVMAVTTSVNFFACRFLLRIRSAKPKQTDSSAAEQLTEVDR